HYAPRGARGGGYQQSQQYDGRGGYRGRYPNRGRGGVPFNASGYQDSSGGAQHRKEDAEHAASKPTSDMGNMKDGQRSPSRGRGKGPRTGKGHTGLADGQQAVEPKTAEQAVAANAEEMCNLFYVASFCSCSLDGADMARQLSVDAT